MARQWIEWDTRFSDKPMEDESRESKVGNWGWMDGTWVSDVQNFHLLVAIPLLGTSQNPPVTLITKSLSFDLEKGTRKKVPIFPRF
jgi:hypothetical protein